LQLVDIVGKNSVKCG